MSPPPRREAGHGPAPDNLPDAELEVLAYLWQAGQATAREIREALTAQRPMTHGSVMTLLSRLAAKRLVLREKGTSGKAFVFSAARKPGPSYRQVLSRMMQRVFRGDRVTMVASLLDTRPPTTDELDALQQLLKDLRTKSRTRKHDDD